jgi:hypothetical protein
MNKSCSLQGFSIFQYRQSETIDSHNTCSKFITLRPIINLHILIHFLNINVYYQTIIFLKLHFPTIEPFNLIISIWLSYVGVNQGQNYWLSEFIGENNVYVCNHNHEHISHHHFRPYSALTTSKCQLWNIKSTNKSFLSLFFSFNFILATDPRFNEQRWWILLIKLQDE